MRRSNFLIKVLGCFVVMTFCAFNYSNVVLKTYAVEEYEFNDRIFKYKTIDNTLSVVVIGCVSDNVKDVQIPNQVEFKNKKYNVTRIGHSAFSYRRDITRLTIPDSVTNIDSFAFSYCVNLETVVIGNSVSKIDDYAFFYCTNLKDLTIGDNVLYIGTYAFNNSRITALKIPDNVNHIGDWAFCYCSYLEKVTIGDSLKSISKGLFFGCARLRELSLSSTDVEISDSSLNHCSEHIKLIYPKI